MKHFIGSRVGTLGAILWEKGGWTGSEQYSDLTIIGKLGYHLFITGWKLMGYPMISELQNEHITKLFYEDTDFWKESES